MKTVLVVEDEAVIAELLSDLLQDEGYEVMVASNGIEAIHCLTHTIPDLIVTDVMMPIMDGLSFCREIKAQPQYKVIPVIIMSAVADRIQTTGYDIIAIIRKPFDIDALLDQIGQILRLY
jgi:CheY-like chemotaxis protein